MIEEGLLPRDSLYNGRKKGWDRFQELWSLNRGGESFQYVPKESLLLPKPVENPQFAEISTQWQYRCVCIDGFFDAKSSHFPPGVVALTLEEAMQTYGIFIQNQNRRSLKDEEDPLCALNSALHGRGLFLYIPPDFEGSEPIEIHHHFSSEKMAVPRVQIYLGQRAKIQIVQTSSFSVDSFVCNGVMDLTLAEQSQCAFWEAQLFSPSARYFGALRASLKKGSRLTALSLMKGAKVSRMSYKVQLLESESEVLLQGLSLLEDQKQNHIHTCVEHAAPDTRSRQHFKSVLHGKSRSSFEGKILVRPVAQKTEAYQRSASLSLSPEAESFAKPNLEIFADDVKASHGATIEKVSEEDLFYLRSRGLSEASATEWLIQGFCAELIKAMPFEVLKRGFQNA